MTAEKMLCNNKFIFNPQSDPQGVFKQTVNMMQMSGSDIGGRYQGQISDPYILANSDLGFAMTMNYSHGHD